MDTNKIAMDTEGLLNAAEKIDSCVGTLRDNVSKFRSVIEGLNSSWSSDVKNKFFTGYEKDLAALNEMITQYSEVSAGIRKIAEQYRSSEEAIIAGIDKAGKACG